MVGLKTFTAIRQATQITFKDSRDTNNLSTAVSMSFNVIYGCCDEEALSTCTATLSDGTQVITPSYSVDYVTCSGLMQITFQATSVCGCFGFKNTKLGLYQTVSGVDSSSIISTSGVQTFDSNDEAIFQQCIAGMASIQAQPLCTYFNATSNQFSLYSTSKELNGNILTQYYKMIATFVGTDSSGTNFSVLYSQTFSFNVNKLDNQTCTEQLNIQSITSKLSLIFFIGIPNTFNLIQEFTIQQGYYISKMNASQTLGTLSDTAFWIDATSLNFTVESSDISIVGTTSSFSVCAFLNNLQFTCSLSISITFYAASETQILASNIAPTFATSIQTPDLLPCLDSNAALRWNFTFPKAGAVDNQNVSIQFTCQNQSTDIFQKTLSKNILTLTLNTTFYTISSSLSCEVILSSTFHKQTKYSVKFIYLCDLAVNFPISTNQTNVKLLVPFAELKSLDSSGKLTIKWNVEIVVPSNHSRRLQQVTPTRPDWTRLTQKNAFHRKLQFFAQKKSHRRLGS